MKTIVAFAASNSRNSINKALALYTAKQLDRFRIVFLDLNDYEMPLYSIDRENEDGIPGVVLSFMKIISEADGIVISFAEHNGAYSVAYKNIYDWVSRVDQGVWMNKPMLLMATAPGPRGGKSVLQLAHSRFSRFSDAKILSFSLPSFNDNFDNEKGILNNPLNNEFSKQLNQFILELSKDRK